jgi:hypothetical protein
VKPIIHIFPMAPAPATFLGLGGVLLRSCLLPRFFAFAALGLAAAFELVALAALFWPTLNALMAVLLSSQEIWILGAAVALVVRANEAA